MEPVGHTHFRVLPARFEGFLPQRMCLYPFTPKPSEEIEDMDTLYISHLSVDGVE